MSTIIKLDHSILKTKNNIFTDYSCYRLSKYLEIHNSGDVSICCYSWLPVFCGNLLTDSTEEILNNTKRVELIKDMESGKFTECRDTCPLLNALVYEKKATGYIVDKNSLQENLSKQLFEINFSYDRSCNLQCPTCRKDLIFYKENENEKITKINLAVKKLINVLLDKGEKLLLNITGSGDSFASPTFFNFLRDLKPDNNIRIKLCTNGILMTEEKWDQIKHLNENIFKINVSIDAAKAETYSIVRPYGSFEKLKQNLLFLNQKIESRSFPNLKAFIVNFTVQKANYTEIVDFVKWQLSFQELTLINFNLVDRWGHISIDEYQANFTLSHEEKLKLKEILNDPIFSHPKVSLGELHSIKNYEGYINE